MDHCTVAGCEEPVHGDGLCVEHHQRRARWDQSDGRTTPVSAPPQRRPKTPRERLQEAALQLADADTSLEADAAYEAALRRLEAAARGLACGRCRRCRHQ